MTDTINTLADPGSDPAHEWQQPDAVNHPGHYTSHPSGVECIQVTEHMSFCLGNAIKYIWRADLKGNAIEDLQKARWYVDREIGRLGGEPADLDHLAADGRLLPEGGTVLTAEQVAEARELLDAVDLDAEEFHLLRAAFTPPAVSVPDSGPDGTPEKPWPTWQDVPEGVVYRGARDTSGWDGWFNRGGTRRRFFDGAPSKNSEATIADEAPFVRVDGDKA